MIGPGALVTQSTRVTSKQKSADNEFTRCATGADLDDTAYMLMLVSSQAHFFFPTGTLNHSSTWECIMLWPRWIVFLHAKRCCQRDGRWAGWYVAIGYTCDGRVGN